MSAIDGAAAPLHGTYDLEGIERVSAGCGPHVVEKRSRQDESQVRLHDLMQSAGVERAHVHAYDAAGGESLIELVQKRAVESRTAREEHADALELQSSARVGEAGGRGRVEPLDVIDRDDDRAIVGERT